MRQYADRKTGKKGTGGIEMRTMRAWVICLVALLCLLPLTVDADTPPQRLPAPAPGVIYDDFFDGFAPVQVGQKYGFIDKTGKFAIPAQFDDERPFSYDLASVKVGEKWEYIDRSGAQVIAPQFDDALGFTEVGLARVKVGDKWGYIDRTGKFAIPAQFDDAIGFYDLPPNTLPQDQPATTAPALAAVKVGDRWGYIDTTGKRVIAPQ
ncbi:MAG: WG repeat-containing protein, partial [Chloroflexota bacterium]|nr:WG repeat-containing protein [Chloroflexota bacterium]